MRPISPRSATAPTPVATPMTRASAQSPRRPNRCSSPPACGPAAAGGMRTCRRLESMATCGGREFERRRDPILWRLAMSTRGKSADSPDRLARSIPHARQRSDGRPLQQSGDYAGARRRLWPRLAPSPRLQRKRRIDFRFPPSVIREAARDGRRPTYPRSPSAPRAAAACVILRGVEALPEGTGRPQFEKGNVGEDTVRG